MINISTTFSFSIIYTKLFPISLTNQYSFILHYRILNNLFKQQDRLHVFVLCTVFKCYLLLLEKVIIYKKKKEEKKNKRRKYEKEEKKKTERKKERKGAERIKKVKIRKNVGKLSLPISTHQYHSIPTMCISILPLHTIYTNSIYPFLPSSFISFGKIIKHQWYRSLYNIFNLFTC